MRGEEEMGGVGEEEKEKVWKEGGCETRLAGDGL